MKASYGIPNSIEEYEKYAQAMAYDGERAMFEAYGANKYISTGVIQWMQNNAWPSMIWHLYDYYLMPGGGYFGTKKACEPVHAQYSYDDKSIVVLNTTHQGLRNLKLTAQQYDIDLKEKFSKVTNLDLPADGNVRAFSIPQVPDLSSTYFLRLTLQDDRGATLSGNFYWLSTKDDVLDWKQPTWWYTPTSSYADMTQLQKLQPAKLTVSANAVRQGTDQHAHVTVSNPGRSLAFFIHLQIKQRPSGRNVLPVIWEDNYFSLLPGESREVTATFKIKDSPGTASVTVESWNGPSLLVPLVQKR